MKTSMALQTNQNLITPEQPEPNKQRLLFIDNIRWLMIVLVVLVHLSVTYSHIGGWFYFEKRPADLFSKMLLALFNSTTQAYFMGFLFFIAGFFVPGSCDKKGNGKFWRDRLIRLGIPTLTFMLLLNPLTWLIEWAFQHQLPSHLFSWYTGYLTSFNFIRGSGPLWFTFALLIFSSVYAMLRLFLPKPQNPANNRQLLTHTRVLTVIALIALLACLIRIIQPIGTNFYNMQLCFFSQYVILFILGIFAYRRNLLAQLSYKFGMFWFKLALFLGIPIIILIGLFGKDNHGKNPLAFIYGGLHWQAAAYALWESFFCIGICLGLLVLFRERFNSQGPLSRFLAANAFGVYVFHPPIVVGFTMLIRNIVIYPVVLKMILVALILLPVCFGCSYLIRRIPRLKKLFS